MRIGPASNVSNNLTIALIERDRADPAPAARYPWSSLPATRVAVSWQAQCAPATLSSCACGADQGDYHPHDACQTEPFSEAIRPCQPEGPYHPHRMPSRHLPYNVQKSEAFATDPFDRLLDVYG